MSITQTSPNKLSTLICLFILSINTNLFSQNVGINTTGNSPDTSAMLDISSTTKGILIPRVSLASLTDVSTIKLPATSLLIYNTNASLTGGVGYYYNSGTTTSASWIKLVTAGPNNGSTWGLTGNSGTDSTTNFIGTTDANPFVLKTNNAERMRVSIAGNVGIGSSAFDPIFPEKLLLNVGTTTSVNTLYAKGTINNYMQTNIRNLSNGSQASSDMVATADNGTETTNFMDIGINGSGYIYQNGNPIETGKANDCYALASGNDFYIVNNNPTRDMIFLTGGTATTNERLRLTSTGYVGLGISTPRAYMHIHDSSTGVGARPLMQLSTGFTGSTTNDGFTVGLENTGSAYNVQFITKETGNIEFYGGSSEAMYIKSTGNIGIGNGASVPNSTLQVAGSVSANLNKQTGATYAITATDYTILCNYTSGVMVVTLPTAVGITGRIYVIKDITTSRNVTVSTTSSQTIDGAGSFTLQSLSNNFFTGITVQSDGINWYVISRF
ncbi:MAG: hypothetical protein ACHQK8_04080 [Bacteroidia bacterium]